MQEIKDLVSVIIPTHNRSTYLKRAIDSVLHQSYQQIEIIIVANGCRDNTTDTVNQIKKDHPSQPILYFEIAEKIGGSKARNIGIEHASGEYLAFLDDDDIWFSHIIASHIKKLAENTHCIVSVNCIYIHGDQEQQYKTSTIRQPAEHTFQDLYYENTLRGFSFCATKRKYIGDNRINEKLQALQDWDIWLKIIKSTGLPAYKEPHHAVYIRIGHQRISGDFPTVLQAQKDFLEIWQSALPNSAINYHQMRIACFTLHTQGVWKNKKRYLALLSTIIKAIFTSTERYNIKRYAHYILLPILRINAVKIWLGRQ